MSKLDVLTIAIVIVCLAALGYLVYKIVALMNPPEETTTSIQDDFANTGTTDDATYTDWDQEVDTAGGDVDLDDDELGGGTANTDDEAGTTGSGNYSDDELDEDGAGIAEQPAEKVEENNNAGSSGSSATATTYDQSATSSGGKYLVIAGSYRQRVNADNQVARLRKMGYSKAAVNLFDKGSYAVVLVDRFGNYGDAKRLVGELSSKGVDAMVSEKN